MELRGQRWIEGSGSGGKDMERRQIYHEGHDKCSEYLESHTDASADSSRRGQSWRRSHENFCRRVQHT